MYSDDIAPPRTLALEFNRFICVGFLKLSYLFYFVLRGIPPPFFWRPSDHYIGWATPSAAGLEVGDKSKPVGDAMWCSPTHADRSGKEEWENTTFSLGPGIWKGLFKGPKVVLRGREKNGNMKPKGTVHFMKLVLCSQWSNWARGWTILGSVSCSSRKCFSSAKRPYPPWGPHSL